jgi:hypothetical protein
LNITPEQIQLALKLDAIFMPYARKQREQALERQAKQSVLVSGEYLRFAHYTSAEAALEIIKTKRLWMRNATCMADFSEVQHGFQILNSFFSVEDSRKKFAAVLDTCAPGAAEEAIKEFNKSWLDIQLDTYITSVSEHGEEEDQHGRLSMWRAFGGSSTRVAIVVKVPMLSGAGLGLNIIFSPVAYLNKDEVHGVIADVMENVKTNCDFLRGLDRSVIVGMVLTMFLAGVACLKHEGFREEREWRAIYSPNRRGSPLIESSTEIIRGVPQVVYKLPLDKSKSSDLADLDFSTLFDRLIIGPSPYGWALAKAFTTALTQAGVTDANTRVRNSFIPIRAV